MRFKIHHLLFWLLAIGFSKFASSQYFHDTFDEIKENKGIAFLQPELDKLLLTADSQETYAKMAHDFSVKLYRLKNYKAAIEYALKEIKSYEDQQLKNISYNKALYQLGYFYEQTSELEVAINYYHKVISSEIYSIDTIQSYEKSGDCYFKLGSYYQAETYYLKSISLLENHNKPGILARLHLSLSKVYHTLNTDRSRKKELESLSNVLEIKEKSGLNERRLSILYNNLANYYNNSKTYDFDNAQYYYKELLNNSIKNNDSIAIGIAYGNLGNLYVKQKEDSAHYYLKKSFNYPLPVETQSRIFRNLTDFELQKGQKDKAIEYLNSAIRIHFSNKDIDLNHPTLVDLKEAGDLIEVISSLSKKGEILLQKHEVSKNSDLAISAFKNLQTADSLIDYIQSSNREENSRLYWRKEASKVYHNVVYCSYLLDIPELAFLYSEKNKALLLTENIIENSAGLPISIKNKKNFLKRKLLQDEQKLDESLDSISLKFYSNSILNQKLELKRYNDSIIKVYPSIFANNFDNQLTSLKEVQQNLQDDEIIISYVWNQEVVFKDHLMCLIITPKNTQVLEIKNASSLKDNITLYLQSLLTSFKTKEQRRKFEKTAHNLYNKLFPSKQLQSQLKGKKVTLITDSQLQNIPFESLVTDIEKGTYLIEQSQINYAYSNSFSKNNNALKRVHSKNLITFSPTNFEQVGLPNLYNTNEEVTSINKYIEGDNYIDSLATKETFLEEINNYKVIHLATHASSGEDPFIAFHDQRLEIKELYALENNAQLVFLSACDTSVGELIQGEGTLTLARGFFHAGSQSVVASLWKASDKSTSIIVEDFYKNINEGKGISTALHLSKLKYIKEHRLSDASPYYWSSLIVMGDDHLITLEDNHLYIWIISGILVLVLGIISLWLYKKSFK
ncbi:CHAT domain-containing protein [Nonlabens xylanidelens]|uniref:CHAT domain-containing protein n=1 Tax=Nonlabens xylanidelens TaxID=191564 RepID=UPI001B80E2B5|nr:CHAT domain-containing protein [Nonlabens xylanidelens]